MKNAFAVATRKIGYPDTIMHDGSRNRLSQTHAGTTRPTPEDWDKKRVISLGVVKYRPEENKSRANVCHIPASAHDWSFHGSAKKN